jgi:hypothetical protein
MQVIGEGSLRLDAFTPEQLTRVEPCPARVRVKAPKGKAGGGGQLHILLHHIPSPEPIVSSRATDTPPPVLTPRVASGVTTPTSHGRLRNGQGVLQTLEEESVREIGGQGRPAGLQRSASSHMNDADSMSARSGGASTRNNNNNLALLTAVRCLFSHW